MFGILIIVIGYLVLSYLLKRKAHLFTDEITDLLFDLAGINSVARPGGGLSESPLLTAKEVPRVPLVSNSHVIRNILLYFEIWKGTSLELQKVMLQRLATLFVDNPQAGYNAYFLRKVRIFFNKMLLIYRRLTSLRCVERITKRA